MRTTVLALGAALLLSSTLFAAPSEPGARRTDILGVRLDASREQVRERLTRKAMLERTEKRQEVWTLAKDPRYASLIVGYTTEGKVRFVTAIAKPNGAPVRYAEVADVTSADHREAGRTHTYTWTSGAHSVIAIGNSDRVEYLSLKKAPVTSVARKGDPDEEEEEDD